MSNKNIIIHMNTNGSISYEGLLNIDLTSTRWYVKLTYAC
jgi:hypothetical protein